MSDEARRILAAAARGERIDEPLDAATLAAAAAVGMEGLLAHHAADAPRELRIVAAAIHARALALAAELARIAEAFREAGIPLLALKGPVVSQQLYGNPGLRLFADLDILVDTADALRGEQLLAALGYRDEEPMTPAQRRTKHRFHNGTAFLNDEHGTHVDFHWRFGHVQFPLALPFADAWRRRVTVDLTGTPIDALGLVDLTIFTCSHAAKHFWPGMETLAQLAALTRLPVDWEEADRVAVAARAARQVGLSFLIAAEELGIALPPLPHCLAASRPVFERLRPRLAATRGHDARGRDLLLLLDRRRDALTALAAAVFVPTHSDWSAMRLPNALYWVVRPLRLLARRVL